MKQKSMQDKLDEAIDIIEELSEILDLDNIIDDLKKDKSNEYNFLLACHIYTQERVQDFLNKNKIGE
tara:strand:- start:1220 stop:1420 length:201 start_codon:yes stop_codon:yes gene_type:complete